MPFDDSNFQGFPKGPERLDVQLGVRFSDQERFVAFAVQVLDGLQLCAALANCSGHVASALGKPASCDGRRSE